MQGPPSPLQFDTALALEDQTIRAIAEAPMDILTAEHPDHMDLDASGQDLSERDAVDQVKAPLSQSSLMVVVLGGRDGTGRGGSRVHRGPAQSPLALS